MKHSPVITGRQWWCPDCKVTQPCSTSALAVRWADAHMRMFNKEDQR